MIRLDTVLQRLLSRRARALRDEGGYSLPELSVAIIVGTVILGGLFTLINFSVRSNAKTTSRVAVDQIARPAMQRIVDGLHSACIYPGLAPVRAGSTGSMLAFITATGSAANPVPELHRVYVDGQGKLIDSTYPWVSGTAPNWSFSSLASENYTLLNRVAQVGSTPIFRYYKYTSGAISSTALPATAPAGLSTENAKLVVQVTTTFQASLSAGDDKVDKNPDSVTQNPVTLSESVLLRFSPSNEDTNKAGLPCT